MSARKNASRFLLCVNNKDYPAALELRKVYRGLSDPEAAKHGLVRVIDESGEDYLYPEKFFVVVNLPAAAKKAFAHAS
jgi:hypothetical protein